MGPCVKNARFTEVESQSIGTCYIAQSSWSVFDETLL